MCLMRQELYWLMYLKIDMFSSYAIQILKELLKIYVSSLGVSDMTFSVIVQYCSTPEKNLMKRFCVSA